NHFTVPVAMISPPPHVRARAVLPARAAIASARVDELRAGGRHAGTFELLAVAEPRRHAADICLLVRKDERAAPAVAAGAAGAADAVQVVRMVLRRVEVDPVADPVE